MPDTTKTKTKIEVTKYPAARTKKIIHAAPQFRPIKRGARKKAIERIYTAKNGDTLTIGLFHELDIADQDLLLCLLAIARVEERGSIVGNSPETATALKLRDELELGGLVINQPAIMIKATGYELLKEIGRPDNKQSYDWLESSLKRLSRVFFSHKTKIGFWSCNLLSVSGLYGKKKGEVTEISICINPLSAQAILGNKDGGYVLINRTERKALEKDETKALHFVLSGLVDMGAERVLSVDMLADKVYCRYDEEITPNATSKRRMNIIHACTEINKLGYWSCSVIGAGSNSVLKVARKKRKEVKTG